MLALKWWLDECDVLRAETSNEGQFHNREGRSTSRETLERSIHVEVLREESVVCSGSLVLECVVGETEMRIWVGGIDAAGARFCISSCGTWKATTRSGACDAS